MSGKFCIIKLNQLRALKITAEKIDANLTKYFPPPPSLCIE